MKNKKNMLLVLTFFTIMMLLAACGTSTPDTAYDNNPYEGNTMNDEPDPSPQETEPDPEPQPSIPAQATLNITSRSDEMLNRFSIQHSYDFLDFFAYHQGLGEDSHFFSIEGNWGVVLWSDVPLRDVQAIIIDYTDDDEHTRTFVAHADHVADEIPADTLLILDRFVTVGGVSPREGISFVDSHGVRRYFAIADDRRGEPGDPPFFLFEFENEGIWPRITDNVAFDLQIEEEELWGARVSLWG